MLQLNQCTYNSQETTIPFMWKYGGDDDDDDKEKITPSFSLSQKFFLLQAKGERYIAF